MKNRNYTLGYAFIQAFFWMNFLCVLAYASYYMLDAGISNSMIGIVIGLAGVFAALIQPLVAGYADRPEAMSLKKIVAIISGIVIVIAALLMLLYGKSGIAAAILYGLSIMLLQFLLPFINSLGTEMIDQGFKVNWGAARGTGSVVYAVVSYLMGVIVSRFGGISVPISILIGFICLEIAVMVYPFQKKKTAAKSTSSRENALSTAEFLKKYPRFCLLLTGMVCSYVSHIILNTYLFQIIEYKGGTSVEMGISMMICAIVEIPTLFLYSFLQKKAGPSVWLRVCTVFLTVKAFLSFFAPTISVYYAVQILQIGGWALISIAPVYYVNQVIDSRNAIKGQAFMAMTYTLGSVLASFAGGLLIDTVGVPATMLFSAVISVAGAVIVFIFAEK